MELHQLRYFAAVAELANFTRAAERCHVSQPSLSQQIINLERELGQRLLERLGRGVRLTEAGKLLYHRAVAVLRDVDDAKREVQEAHAQGGGKVSIGAIPTIAPYFLPGWITSFRRQFPRTEVVIHEDFTAQLVEGCAAGELDVAVLALPVAGEHLEAEPLFQEELLLAAASEHPLARRRKVTMAEVANEPFVLLSEIHCLGEQILAFCKQQACLPAISCHSAQLLTAQELIASGHGVSFVPAMAAAADRSKARKYRSLHDARPMRTVAMICKSSRLHSPLVQRLHNSLRAYSRTFAASRS